jgi:secreted trypsin-like serine protease
VNARTRSAIFAASVGTALLLVACSADEDGPGGVDDSQSDIVGDVIANREHPEVVQLRIYTATDSALCTGTLVGHRTILTARHCMTGAIAPDGTCDGDVSVDLTGTGALGGDQYHFERCVLPLGGRMTWNNDLALIRLTKPVEGVTPARYATTPTGWRTYTTYGYGRHGGERLVHGCTEAEDGNKRKTSYRGDLGVELGSRPTCPGDSGGPHFIAGTNIVAGITSGGFLFFSGTATTYADADQLTGWIAAFER